MTKTEFDGKIRNFCRLVKWRTGTVLGENYLKEEVFKYCIRNNTRMIPKLAYDEKNFNVVMEHQNVA